MKIYEWREFSKTKSLRNVFVAERKLFSVARVKSRLKKYFWNFFLEVSKCLEFTCFFVKLLLLMLKKLFLFVFVVFR